MLYSSHTAIFVAEWLLVVSFVLLAIQYYLIYSAKRVFVVRFWLMAVIFVLMIVTSLMPSWSAVSLVLALLVFGLVAHMHWRMVLSRRPKNWR